MMRWPGPLLLALTMALVGGGCPLLEKPDSSYPLVSQPTQVERAEETDVRTQVYTATDTMLHGLRAYVDPRRSIIPASFVNADNLESTSPLGRLLASMMSSRMTQRGFAMSQVKLRKSLLIKDQSGEFLLSRDLDELRQSGGGQAVLVGWYTIARQTIYVSAQLVGLKDRVAIASTDFELPITANVRALLGLKPGQRLEDLEK